MSDIDEPMEGNRLLVGRPDFKSGGTRKTGPVGSTPTPFRQLHDTQELAGRMDGIRLTQFAHGGGCGCKLAPNVLQDLLSEQLVRPSYDRLLVGNESSDDAAAWLLNDEDCVLATTDFFTPIVDDPYEFGRIAATNAISDIYAMGGRPVMALALLGVPVDKLPADVTRAILRGGADVCAAAGIPVAGGHSIDAPEPIYGLAVTGVCKLSSLRRNRDARAGDAVILTKPLGIGIYSAALKKGLLDAAGYQALVETTTMLNRVGADLGLNPQVHAVTDVTGFGLAGHALEIAKASGLGIEIDVSALPLLPQAESLARQDIVTGASARNWRSYGERVAGVDALPAWQRHLLTDPQTSGGLLFTCAASAADDIVDQVRAAGFAAACRIGRVSEQTDAGTIRCK